MDMMTHMEEDAEKLFKEITEIKAIEWDSFIDRLKKSFPVPDAELEEMRKRRKDIRNDIEVYYLTRPSSTRAQVRQLQLLSRKLWRDIEDIYENFTEEEATEVNSDPRSLDNPEQLPPPTIANTEDGNVAAASLDASSLVEATLQLPTPAKADIPLKEGGRTKRKRRSRKKATLGPNMKMPSPKIMMKIQRMKLLMSLVILTRRMKMSRRKRIQDSVGILQNPAPRPQCRPFHCWKGSSQPRAEYRSAPKPVPASSFGQLWRRHRSYAANNCQSHIDPRLKRKDSYTNAAALEPGDVNNANQDEKKIEHLAPVEAYTHYDVQSPQDNAVKAWLVDPYT